VTELFKKKKYDETIVWEGKELKKPTKRIKKEEEKKDKIKIAVHNKCASLVVSCFRCLVCV
jgi:hypothetical protein